MLDLAAVVDEVAVVGLGAGALACRARQMCTDRRHDDLLMKFDVREIPRIGLVEIDGLSLWTVPSAGSCVGCCRCWCRGSETEHGQPSSGGRCKEFSCPHLPSSPPHLVAL